MSDILMKCGCRANSTCSSNGDMKFDPPIPSCCIHDCIEVAYTQPDLKGRKAICCYCKTEVDSKLSLPFFEYKPDKDRDAYYCGCRGWD